MMETSSRIRAVDWLRGLAALLMVETHCVVLLKPELRTGLWFTRLDFINGLVAPSFIFAAGFSLALVQVRTALSTQERLPRHLRIRKTLRRVAEVLGVGLLVNFIWFPIRHEPQWLFRLDILLCIAVSLLMALPLIVGFASRPRALTAVLLVLACTVFGITPLGEQVTGPWANVLNRSGSLHPLFPLLPWMGYVFLGAAMGTVAARWSTLGMKWFLAVFILGSLALSYASVGPSNHTHRAIWVGLFLLALLLIEERLSVTLRKSPLVRWVELFGTTSLAAYFFHEEILFLQLGGRSFADHFRDQCGWFGFLTVLLIVWFATWVLVRWADRLYPKWEAWNTSEIIRTRIQFGSRQRLL